MTKYTEEDLQALAALMDFGATGPASPPARPATGAARYLPADLDQFAKLTRFAGSAPGISRDNTPTPPPRQSDRSRPPPGYTATDAQGFERIARTIQTRAGSRDTPPATRDTPPYTPGDRDAFAALGGEPAAPDPAPQSIRAAPPYNPPARPAPRDYFAIKTIDADAERAREGRYFQTTRPTIKIVFSDAGGKKPW